MRKRMSTFSSRHIISDSHICEHIFKNYLPTSMMRPSDSIIFTISFTRPWIYYKFDLILFFYRYTWAFCLDLFGSMMFPNNSADSVSMVYLSFLNDMLNVPEDNYGWKQIIFSCLYLNLSHSCLEPADCLVGPLFLLQMWSWTRFSIGRLR
jgi:Plant mobile domain